MDGQNENLTKPSSPDHRCQGDHLFDIYVLDSRLREIITNLEEAVSEDERNNFEAASELYKKVRTGIDLVSFVKQKDGKTERQKD